jgi:hypothetical protein
VVGPRGVNYLCCFPANACRDILLSVQLHGYHFTSRNSGAVVLSPVLNKQKSDRFCIPVYQTRENANNGVFLPNIPTV